MTATTDATDLDVAALARAAALELAVLLPTSVPLEVAEGAPKAFPARDADAVRGSFVGSTSADVVVVADAAVADALALADATISLEDALRPALEAACATLGAGVLDTSPAGPIGEDLMDPEVVTIALEAMGEAHAWFGLRIRRAPQVVPQQRTAPDGEQRIAMRVLQDVEMTLTAEIGRTRLPVRQVLDLVPGSVLELDRAAGSPADVMVNGRLVARGEVVVIDEEYGVRITEIVDADGAS